MNTNPHDHRTTPDEHQGHREPVQEQSKPEPETRQTPEAIEAANLRRRERDTLDRTPLVGDPDAMAEAEQQNQVRRARGVEWVRPTDLMNRSSAALAGRGIDLEVDLARKSREKLGAGMRGLGDRARNLSPLSSFGRGQRHDAPTRAAVGKS